jgi:hypothetical protein
LSESFFLGIGLRLSPENLNHEEYKKFWGDEYAWTCMVSFFWKNYETKFLFKIDKENRHSHDQAVALWSGAIHLLCLGLGWREPAKGLRRWREAEYPIGIHPILDYLRNIFDSDLFALEIFLGQFVFEITNSLPTTGSGAQGSIDGQRIQTWYQDQKRNLESSFSPLASKMLFGGWDPLHLIHHASDSFSKKDSGRDGGPVSSRLDEENAYCLELDRYSGWAHLLDELGLQMQRESLDLSQAKVLVHVRNEGTLGWFQYDSWSHGWFITGNAGSFSSRANGEGAHRWGNSAALTQSTEKRAVSKVEISPKYGFALSDEAGLAFAEFLEGLDESQGELFEELEIHVRGDAGLAHSMTYRIASLDQGEEQEEYWSRVEGSWFKGFMVPSGKIYDSCLIRLVKDDLLDKSLKTVMAVLEGSATHDVQPWAVEYAIALWDCMESFPEYLSWICSLGPEAELSVYEFDPRFASQAIEDIERFRGKATRAKDLWHLGELNDFPNGQSLGAERFLICLVSAYEYFGA